MPAGSAFLTFSAIAGFVVLGAFTLTLQRSARRYKRERYIRNYVFSKGVLQALSKAYPNVAEKDTFLVARALRAFFLVHARAGGSTIGMPSKVVDALWHEFILDTRAYHDFCSQAFGAYFHHLPAARMRAQLCARSQARCG